LCALTIVFLRPGSARVEQVSAGQLSDVVEAIDSGRDLYADSTRLNLLLFCQEPNRNGRQRLQE
jgi:hypothetical protein